VKKSVVTINFIFGIIAIVLVIQHVAAFIPHDYFYNQNPTLTLFSGVNVVSRWADFSFFTYHTVIFYGLWAVGLFFAYSLKLKSISFFTNSTVVTFVLTNYILTAVIYTAFELLSGNPTFGLYALNGKAIHNFGTNILAHYVICAVCAITCLKIKTQGEIKPRHVLIILAYLIIYCIAVKLTGRYCYKIEWYPYPIFHGDLLMAMLGITSYNVGIKIICIFIVFAFLAIAYFLIFFVVSKIKAMAQTKTDF